jgi:hypothetical protein
MDAKLKLNLDQLTVESFAASSADDARDEVRTCMNTQCGNIQCCA